MAVRIAVITRSLGINGASVFILDLGYQLRRQGYDVEIVTTLSPGPLATNIVSQGLTWHHIHGFERSIPVFHIKKIARTLIDLKYDVIILNHDRYTQSIISMLPDHTIVLPVLHNDQTKIINVAYANSQAWNVAVAVSEKLRERALTEHPERPVVAIENGVQIPSVDAWTRRKPFSLPLELLFVGRVNHEQKGVLFLPQILHDCSKRAIPVHLNVIGDGEDLQRLKQRIADEDQADHVTFYGTLPHEGVVNIMLQSHILLFPSFYEGFGLTVVEAQACGCIPVSSYLLKITDRTILDGKTGFLVDIGDTGAMVNAIGKMVAAPGEWTRMSAAAREFVMNQYSLERMGKDYAALIEELLQGKYPLPRSRRELPAISTQLLSSRDYSPESFRILGRKITAPFKHHHRSSHPPNQNYSY
ncbi:MAG TPA: glycosyltransferase family 4 protein [Armatimonadota bacterium]|nr:glycosyltransferase family 4 protein [Armatimonadota bacterium]